MLQTSGLPPGVTGSVPGSARQPSGTETYSYSGPMIPAAVASRISRDNNARIMFATQALIYSAGATSVVPDGLVSTLSAELRQLQSQGAQVGSSENPTTATLTLVRQFLYGRNPGLALRVLPWQMPQYLIDQVNDAARSVDSQFVYLQVMPAVPVTSAGQAISPAG